MHQAFLVSALRPCASSLLLGLLLSACGGDPSLTSMTATETDATVGSSEDTVSGTTSTHDGSSSTDATGSTGHETGEETDSESDPCESSVPLDPSTLAWEALPGLGMLGDGAEEALVTVDRDGTLYVGARFWREPARLEIHRLAGNAWELIGGQPIGDERAQGIGVEGDTVFVLTANGLYSADGGPWQSDDASSTHPDAAGLLPAALAQDQQGRLVLMMTGADQARVFRRSAEAWESLPGALVPEPNGLHGNADWWRGRLALNCTGHAAAIFQGTAFLFEGDAWESLGRYVTEDDATTGQLSANWPRISLTSDDRPVITWRSDHAGGSPRDPTLDQEVMIVRHDPVRGGFERLGSPLAGFDDVTPPGYSTVAVSNADDIFLAWREASVHLAYFADDGWMPLVGDGALHESGTLPSLAVDPVSGLPVVAWAVSGCDDCPPFAVGRAIRR